MDKFVKPLIHRDEKDDFIGTTHEVGGGLIVIGHNGLTGNKKRYFCKCNICSNDEELWPEGSITTSKSDLNRLRTPCGCASVVQWKQWQQIIRVQRYCKSRGYIYEGLAGKWKGGRTRIILFNPQDNNRWCPTISNILHNKSGCPKEALRLSGERQRMDKEVTGKVYRIKGSELTVTEPLPRGKNEPLNVICTCNICSKDKELWPYGSIKSYKGSLDSGTLPCGCSSSTKLKKWQYKIIIERVCKERSLEFRGFKGKYRGCKTKIILFSKSLNVEWDTSTVSSFINQDITKPCQGYNKLLKGRFYVVLWSHIDGKKAVKVGITNLATESRIKDQAKDTEFTSTILLEGYHNKGRVPYEVERGILKYLAPFRKFLSKEEFPDGYSETFPYDETILEYISESVYGSSLHITYSVL